MKVEIHKHRAPDLYLTNWTFHSKGSKVEVEGVVTFSFGDENAPKTLIAEVIAGPDERGFVITKDMRYILLQKNRT